MHAVVPMTMEAKEYNYWGQTSNHAANENCIAIQCVELIYEHYVDLLSLDSIIFLIQIGMCSNISLRAYIDYPRCWCPYQKVTV